MSLRSEGRRFTAISLVLLLFIPLTWGARQWSLREGRARLEDRRLDALTESFSRIQDDFELQQSELLDLGRALASESDLRRSLAEWAPGSPPDERLVELLAAVELPDRVSVEVYDPTPRLVAWTGFSMPLDDGPSRPRFLEDLLVATARDGPRRTAVVIWWPVRDGLRVVGALRVMKLVEIGVPVENQYLKSFSQAAIWSEQSRLPVSIRYDVPFDDILPSDGEVRLLTGIDGTALGRVFIESPDERAVLNRIQEPFDDVLAFWTTLLLIWALTGSWRWYRTAALESRVGSAWVRFLWFATALVAGRMVLVQLNVPARFQRGPSPLAALFDPTFLASSAGWGLFRSTGDLVITSVFAVVLSLAAVTHVNNIAAPTRDVRFGSVAAVSASLKSIGTWLGGLVVLILSIGLAALLASVSQSVVLDSTLEYFARTGLLPERLVLVVFASLFLVTAAAVLMSSALMRLAMGWSTTREPVLDAAGIAGAAVVATVLLVALNGGGWLHRLIPLQAVFLFGAASLGAALASRSSSPARLLAMRTLLPALIIITAVQYPLFYRGMQAQRQMRMVDAAASFEDWRDPRVLYAVERVLKEAQTNPEWTQVLDVTAYSDRVANAADSLLAITARNSFLASLGSYEISVTAYGADETPIGRYYEIDPRLGSRALEEVERLDLDLLKGMYEESGSTDVLVEPITDPERTGRFPYYGVAPFRTASGRIVGWLVARAEPRTLLREAITPFPRVLVPAGFYGNVAGRLSVAVFRDGALVRSTGDDFASYRLPEDVSARLVARGELWQTESLRGDDFDSYYRLEQNPDAISGVPVATVITVRIPAVNFFDHLYNLLRLTFGGLVVGLPIYLLGLYLRRARGLLPAPRVRFRDKILNAFLGVGLVTVALMGVVGLNVVTKENEREIEERLRQHLERVERSIALDARSGELTYRVLDRIRIDSLSARVGLDINVFRGSRLVSSSRPQLVRDRLIDPRLPITAYEALYVDGLKFARTEERLGNFTYTAGFRAIPNEEGRPYFVISIPTLPEQDAIEEEQARTVAYLFGALLLLVLVVLITASLLANALTRPIARLRDGIEAVAHGRFNRIRPLNTRDEVSELVDSFNSMQDQLGDSRRRLARQERQLAWREMARQVAHEIKNPLTPMKLSVQHLRRSYKGRREGRDSDFAGLFDRITTTLTDQIDALARIANEFSSFARMPSRIDESLDINSVVEEAAALMQAEVAFDIEMDLVEDPLIVRADREEVRRIFINLIKNAIQAIPPERPGRIRITTRLDRRSDRPWAHATVADNGVGIPPDARSRIFVPNFSTKTSGAGLGLAIVRKSVEDLNGEIGFETAESEGTSFWIRLPLSDEDTIPEDSGPR